MKQVGVELAIVAAGYVTFKIVLPEVQYFTHEKVYTFFAEKRDSWRAKKNKKVKESNITTVPSVRDNQEEVAEASENCKIINLEDYRKRA